MLIKILGGIDVVFGLLLILLGAGIPVGKNILMFIGVVLLIKSSLGFLKDFGSWTDFVGGIFALLSVFFPFLKIIDLIIGLVLIQKGVVSFL